MSTERPPLAAEVGAERERADSRNQVAASFQVAIPEPFCFSRPEEWEKWSRRFERFRIASGLTLREDEVQVSTLIYAMGDQADDILHSFALSEENRKSYQMVKSKFDDHFVKRRNVIFERAKFNRLIQEGGESVDTFITALYSLAEHCGYSELHDEMIRDRIVVGIRNSALSEKLQLDPRLTLDSAISQVRQSEAINRCCAGGNPIPQWERSIRGEAGQELIGVVGATIPLQVTNNHKMCVPGVADALPTAKLSAQPKTNSVTTATSEVTTNPCAGPLPK